jgi:tetratricopeptide (TPR) repeat protein
MADDLLGGVLGGDGEQPETEAPKALAGAEAFAAAIAAIASRQDPAVARKTEAFLDKQARLLDVQTQHLEDEHALRLNHLAHQSHLLLGQRLSQAIRLSFQVVIALVVIVIGIGIAVMLHDAFSSHSVVIDSFNAPAGLVSRGVTGTVVASEVLNELTQLQQATRSNDLAQQKRNLSNGWSNEVRVDVPETGVSLGEISRLLRARFGHDLHIGGSLVQSASGGLALSVSGDNLAPKTFTGGADDLDKLVVDAAQYVYSQFQPALWVHYLVDTNHCPEAVSIAESLYDTADDQSRASFLTDWAGCLRDSPDITTVAREGLQMYEEAIALDPQFWWAYAGEESALSYLGEEEEAWRVSQSVRRAAGSHLSRLVARGEPALFLSDMFLTHDLQAATRELIADAAANGGIGSIAGAANSPDLAVAEAELHDRAAAELTSQALGALTAHLPPWMIHGTRALVDGEFGDTTDADAEWGSWSETGWHGFMLSLICAHAWIEEAAGHSDKANAILALPGAAHLVDCQRFRGDILDHRGDWGGAQQAYAQSVALAPDLPAGYYSWGVALARHNDLAGALAKLQAANQRGPHWADPLKAWGDVLAKEGHWSDALEKYDEALKYAPNWAALKEARAAAATKTRA